MLPNGTTPVGLIIALVIGAAFIVVGAWTAIKSVQQQKNAKDLMATGEDMQQKMYQRAERLQAKEEEILARWDAILKRLESLASRMDIRS